MPGREQGDIGPERHSVVSAACYVLTGIARDRGHDVTVSDPSTWGGQEDWQRELYGWIDAGADLIGFSCHSFNWAMTRQAIIQLKQSSPGTIIVVGGVHPTHRPRHVLESCPADFVVQGEGELPFAGLLDALSAGQDPSSIAGLGWRNGDTVVLNAPAPPRDLQNRIQALPAYELIPPGTYSSLTADTSRGCRGSCAFCSIPSLRHWRGFSPTDSVERIRHAHECGRPNVTTDTMYLSDDCFTCDRDRAMEICAHLASERLPIRFALEARVNDLLDDGMRRAIGGIRVQFIQIGVECGYERGLKLVRKGTTLERIRSCASLLQKDGLAPAAMMSFIIGLPWEDESDCMATLRFAADLTGETGVGVNTVWWVPIPSELWERRAEFGIGLPDDIFDTVGWDWNSSIVRAYQPRLDAAAHRRIEERIAAYGAMGQTVRRKGPTALDLGFDQLRETNGGH